MVLLGILDISDGHEPESWVTLPRYHHQYLPDTLQYEPEAFDEGLRVGLTRLGHRLKDLSSSYGNMQAVYWDKVEARVLAASDPRGEGEAVVWNGRVSGSPPLNQKRAGKVMESHGQ